MVDRTPNFPAHRVSVPSMVGEMEVSCVRRSTAGSAFRHALDADVESKCLDCLWQLHCSREDWDAISRIPDLLMFLMKSANVRGQATVGHAHAPLASPVQKVQGWVPGLCVAAPRYSSSIQHLLEAQDGATEIAKIFPTWCLGTASPQHLTYSSTPRAIHPLCQGKTFRSWAPAHARHVRRNQCTPRRQTGPRSTVHP